MSADITASQKAIIMKAVRLFNSEAEKIENPADFNKFAVEFLRKIETAASNRQMVITKEIESVANEPIVQAA